MCTLEKRGKLFILTLTGSDDHRLNPTLIDSISSKLQYLRTQPSNPSSVLITTAQGKFFSNGYDLSWAQFNKTRLHLMSSKFRLLISDLLTLPMPTIAAVTGHASAGGFVLALAHDYVLMGRDKGFLYMSEMDIGYKIPDWFVDLLKCKIGSAAARRAVVLKAAKLTAGKAVEMGVIDEACGSKEETVEAAVGIGEELVGRKWDGHVYGENRKTLFAEVLSKLDPTAEISSIITGSRL